MSAREEDLAWIVERLDVLAKEGKSDELVRALKRAVQGDVSAAEEPAAQDVQDAIDLRQRGQENA